MKIAYMPLIFHKKIWIIVKDLFKTILILYTFLSSVTQESDILINTSVPLFLFRNNNLLIKFL